jgi:hypothetical protein
MILSKFPKLSALYLSSRKREDVGQLFAHRLRYLLSGMDFEPDSEVRDIMVSMGRSRKWDPYRLVFLVLT